MDIPVLQLTGVSKHYHTRDKAGSLIKAVDDVSVYFQKGTMTGLVGKNGCGKSTLLKMIAGITKPTAGTIEIQGPLMAFTDFSAGFHPDLSGIENIYLAGSLYGLKKTQIRNLLPEITAFSELENFLEMPVKNYSQGMFLRLAFSLMVHLPLGVVLLDEALAVGDEAFRQKCYRKIRDLRKQGLTIVFVSHDFIEIAALCDRCIVMEHGKIIADGAPDEVYNFYMKSIHGKTKTELLTGADIETNFEMLKPGYIKIVSVAIKNAESAQSELYFTSPIVVSIVWEKLVKEGSVFFDVILSDSMNRPILATANYYGKSIDVKGGCNSGKTGTFKNDCVIPAYFMNHGLVNVSILGTFFNTRNSHFTVFNTARPLTVLVKNSVEESHDYYWVDANAPIRTTMSWQETEIV